MNLTLINKNSNIHDALLETTSTLVGREGHAEDQGAEAVRVGEADELGHIRELIIRSLGVVEAPAEVSVSVLEEDGLTVVLAAAEDFAVYLLHGSVGLAVEHADLAELGRGLHQQLIVIALLSDGHAAGLRLADELVVHQELRERVSVRAGLPRRDGPM